MVEFTCPHLMLNDVPGVGREGAQSLLSSSMAIIADLGLTATLLSPQSQNKAKQCKESATEAGM